ncbi:MAG: ATP-grasp domain-containing protein [Leptospiraceae bacterium]|nr:ATP-grasp domain-containing protein [Leptospiraceae bacterium]MCK6379705.1 ATP-grasp domain-containing protein [Leptospiraceae bacterium]NUM40509.1 ATP-grasp domain-containing protein [Leptospiraceae bacterium]
MRKDGYFISLGAGKNQIPLIHKANALGLKVISVDKNDKAPGFHFTSIKIIESVHEYRKLYKSIGEIPLIYPIYGVGTRSFGKTVYSASYLAEKLKLPGVKPNSLKIFDNKRKLKEFLEKKGIKVPNYYNWRSNSLMAKTIAIISYPCILKPSFSESKKGIELFYNKDELKEKLNKISPDDSSYLLEEFIEGKEITVLGLVQNQTFHLVSISDKITTTYPPFIEISHRLPSDFEDHSGEIKIICQSIVNLTGIDNCPFVAEFKITNSDEIYLMEVKPEVGGEYLADYLIPQFYGYDYFQNLIKVFIGEPIETKAQKSDRNLKKSHIVFFAPPENKSKLKQISPFEVEPSENLFFRENLKQEGDTLLTSQGNHSRVLVLGIETKKNISHEEFDKSIRERISVKFES